MSAAATDAGWSRAGASAGGQRVGAVARHAGRDATVAARGGSESRAVDEFRGESRAGARVDGQDGGAGVAGVAAGGESGREDCATQRV